MPNTSFCTQFSNVESVFRKWSFYFFYSPFTYTVNDDTLLMLRMYEGPINKYGIFKHEIKNESNFSKKKKKI